MSASPSTRRSVAFEPPGFRGASAASVRAALVLCLFLSGAFTVFVHSPVLSGQALCFDDDEFLTANPLVQNPSWGSVSQFMTEVFEPSTVRGYYAPLSMTSLMLDFALGGRPDDLRQFHRTNLGLHALNTMALVLLLYGLSGLMVPALLVGLLFGAHPLTVEPLAWVAERKTLLATFFSLGGLLAYLRYSIDGIPRGRWVALALFALACLSKPTAVVLPALMLTLDYWPLRRLDRKAIFEKIPFFVLAVSFATITLVSHQRTVGIEVARDGLFSSLLTAFHLIAFYLGKVVWPVDLTSVYLLPDPMVLENPIVLLGLVVCLVLAATTVWLATRGVLAPLAGGLFFSLALAPTLGGLRFSWVTASDKYVYLPAVGVAMIVLWVFGVVWNHPGRRSDAAKAGLVALVLVLAVTEASATRDQLSRWRDTETLYRHMLRHTPDFALLHLNLGEMLWQRGRAEEAKHHYYRALESEPDYAKVHNNLGVLFWSTRQPTRAIEHLSRAVAAEPGLAESHANLGIAFSGVGRFEKALEAFESALAIDANNSQTHCGAAFALVKLGRIAQARTSYEASLRLGPGCVLPPGSL